MSLVPIGDIASHFYGVSLPDRFGGEEERLVRYTLNAHSRNFSMVHRNGTH